MNELNYIDKDAIYYLHDNHNLKNSYLKLDNILNWKIEFSIENGNENWIRNDFIISQSNTKMREDAVINILKFYCI